MDGLLAAGLRCARCDSDQLRRSHSRSGLQKLLRRHTSLDRYACSACGHRGWSWGRVSSASTLAGRRPERRDHRLQRRVRVRSFLTVAAALALGVVVAVSLQRCGISAPSAE